MIAKGDEAYGANKMLGLNPFNDGPTWCFDRFGRSTTWLPNGRVVLIAGEHEDSYDPDFCIYNYVVLVQPREKAESVTRYLEMRDGSPNGFAFGYLDRLEEEGDEDTEYVEVKRVEMREAPRPEEITVYGYLEGVFPPTDGHVAVHVRTEGEGEMESIYIVGGVGYHNGVHRQRTGVFRLDLADFGIEWVPCTGELPPHDYDAVRSRRARLVGKEIVTRELNGGEKYSLDWRRWYRRSCRGMLSLSSRWRMLRINTWDKLGRWVKMLKSGIFSRRSPAISAAVAGMALMSVAFFLLLAWLHTRSHDNFPNTTAVRFES